MLVRNRKLESDQRKNVSNAAKFFQKRLFTKYKKLVPKVKSVRHSTMAPNLYRLYCKPPSRASGDDLQGESHHKNEGASGSRLG